MERFSASHAEIEREWRAFREEYHAWRRGLEGCSQEDFRADLLEWVARFEPVVRRAIGLEAPAGAGEVTGPLLEAATTEEAGLRALRDRWAPGDTRAFAAYEDARSKAAGLRRRARDRLATLLARARKAEERGPVSTRPAPRTPEPTPLPTPTVPLPPEGPPVPSPPPPATPTPGNGGEGAEAPELLPPVEELEALSARADELAGLWDGFHSSYDDWRRRNGDCAAGRVQAKLEELLTRFRKLRAGVFDLNRPDVVRPQAELLFEAAAREQRALAELRRSWVAYDPRPWARFEAAMDQVDSLRHQVGSDLDELRRRYGPP